MNSSIPIDPGNHYDLLYAIAQIIQLISILFALLITCLTLYIFHKAPQFHKNMMALIFNLFIEGIIVYILKIALIVEWFLCKKECCKLARQQENFLDDHTSFIFTHHLFYVEFIKVSIGVAYLSAMPFIIFERIFATVQLKAYERTVNYPFIIFCAICQYVVGFLIMLLIYNG